MFYVIFYTLSGIAIARAEGVTLYEHINYGGRSEQLKANDPDLRNNPIGQDTVSSIKVSAGCKAHLYTDINYGGWMQSFTEDFPDLRSSRIGHDNLSSIKIICRKDISIANPQRPHQGDKPTAISIPSSIIAQ